MVSCLASKAHFDLVFCLVLMVSVTETWVGTFYSI